MNWWLWVLLGLALLLAELLTPGGFYLIFFGAGALLTGVLLLLFDIGSWMQLVLFSALSISSLGLFRRRLLAMRKLDIPDVDSLVGETAFALEDIPAEGFGKAELRGSAWSVRNAGETLIGKSQRCRVERVDGLTLWVR